MISVSDGKIDSGRRGPAKARAASRREISFAAAPAHLTSTQRELLLEAAARKAGLIVFPDRLRGRILQQIASGLIARGYAKEIAAKGEAMAYRRDGERSVGLVITGAGRKALGLSATKTSAAAPDAEPEKGTEPARLVEPAAAVQEASGAPGASGASVRPDSKIAAVVALLQRPQGVRMEELMAQTGWLAHTARAALTGLRKRGYVIERESSDSGAIWRIAAAPAARGQ